LRFASAGANARAGSGMLMSADEERHRCADALPKRACASRSVRMRRHANASGVPRRDQPSAL
jgi:hypothetical protein